jgi:hypothetical protein
MMNFKKIGVLGITLIFGSICFVNTPAISNASVQSVLSVAKGGTNANNAESAQKNLGLIDSISHNSTDNQFPSSKAVYDFIKNRLSRKMVIVGTNGYISVCDANTNCNEASKWSSTFSKTSSLLSRIHYFNNQYIAIGNSGIITGCKKQLDCSNADNWSEPSQISNQTSNWWGVDSSDDKIIISGAGGKVSQCLSSQDCTLANNWSEAVVTPGAAGNWGNVVYADNRFSVAEYAGTFSQCLASSDCSIANSWSNAIQTPGQTGKWIGQAYGGGKWILAGESGLISICQATKDCTEANSWSTAAKAGSASQWDGVVYMDGKFLLVGTGGMVSQCDDTISDCSLTASWSASVQIGEQTETWAGDAYYPEIKKVFLTGPSGKVAQCSAVNDCSQANNWITISVSSIAWYQIAYG